MATGTYVPPEGPAPKVAAPASAEPIVHPPPTPTQAELDVMAEGTYQPPEPPTL